MSLFAGQGNQIINYNYGLSVSSEYMNKLLYNIFSAGVLYDGENHDRILIDEVDENVGSSTNVVTIKPISFLITPKNNLEILIKVDTTECFTISYTIPDEETESETVGQCEVIAGSSSVENSLKLVARLRWEDDNNNTCDFIFTRSELDTDVILCEIIDNQLVFTNQTQCRLKLIKPNEMYDDSDSLDCYEPGNASGNIPISNRIKNVNLNAETLQLNLSNNFAKNNSILQTGLVSEKINDHYLQPQDGVTTPGSFNDIPISNGILQKNLNAQYLNGKTADYFEQQIHEHNLDDLEDNQYSKVLNVNSSGKLTYESITHDDIDVNKLAGIGYDTTAGSTYKLSVISGYTTLYDVPELNESERYIIDDTNNKLYFYENSTATLIISELANGNYGADELAALIETNMEADGANTYTVVYDDSDNTFDFVNDTGTDFELLTNPNFMLNGDFESWASATNANNWTEYISGTSTINREAVLQHGGTYCLRIDVDSSNSDAYFHQQIALYADDVYTLKFWYMTEAAKTAHYRIFDVTTSEYLQADGSWDAATHSFSLIPSTSWLEVTKEFIPESDGNYMFLFGKLIATSSSIYFDDITVTDEENISDLINCPIDTGFVNSYSTDEVFGEDFYTYVPEEAEIDFEAITGVDNIRMRNPRIFLQKVIESSDISSTDIARFALRNAFAYDITSSGFKLKQFPQIIISSDGTGVDSNTYIKVDRDLKEDDFTYYWAVFGEKYLES